MTFVTKEWKDRLVEYAGRRKLKNVATGEEVLVDVSRSEGTVNQAGDAFSAANMNNLEQRIANEFKTMTSNFQAGVDSVYNKIKAQGTTPGSKALSDVVNAIPVLSNNRYNAGRVQGRNDVIANPGAYGINTAANIVGTYKYYLNQEFYFPDYSDWRWVTIEFTITVTTSGITVSAGTLTKIS